MWIQLGSDVVGEDLQSEVLLCDTGRAVVHRVATAEAPWVMPLLAGEAVEVADGTLVRQLIDSGLVAQVNSGTSRRQIITRTAGAAAAVGATSIILPSVAAAATGGGPTTAPTTAPPPTVPPGFELAPGNDPSPTPYQGYPVVDAFVGEDNIALAIVMSWVDQNPPPGEPIPWTWVVSGDFNGSPLVGDAEVEGDLAVFPSPDVEVGDTVTVVMTAKNPAFGGYTQQNFVIPAPII